MDVDSSQGRMAAYMRDHQDKVVSRWTELVLAGLRGRSSDTEVRRELEDGIPPAIHTTRQAWLDAVP